jgi:hypothetical protein
MRWSSRRKIGVYLAITFVPSWALAIGFHALGGEWGSAAGQSVALVFMMPPAFAALIVKGAILREPVLQHLGLSLSLNRWWLVAWLVPPLAFGLSLVLGAMMPGVELALSVDDFIAHYRPMVPADQLETFEAEVRGYGMHPAIGMLLQAMVAGMTINALRGLGEELGWRGLMHHELSGDYWRKVIATGLVWGIWYAPLVVLGFRYPGAPVSGVLMNVAWCLLFSAIATHVRVKSGSVIVAAILYGTFEGIAKLPPLVRGGDAITTGVFGLPGLAALGIVLLALRQTRFVSAARQSESTNQPRSSV